MPFNWVRKHKKLTAFILIFLCSMLGSGGCMFYGFMNTPLPAVAKPPSPPPFSPGSEFMVGVNYPWNKYGSDFGQSVWGHHGVSTPDGYAKVESDFAHLEVLGIKSVRWFLLCDGRSGLILDGNNKVIGLDEKVFQDLDAALEIARRHRIKIIFVIVDFSVFNSRHRLAGNTVSLGASLAENPEHRDAFINNAVVPILEKFGGNDNILAWEVVNEPEWAMNIAGGRSFKKNVSTKAMQDFVNQVVNAIHANTKHLATVGSGRRDWLKYWKNSNLDFYQYHYYPHQEWVTPFDAPITLSEVDKPCILGEFPTKGGKRGLTNYLETSHKNGLAGAFAWGLNSQDRYSNLHKHADELRKWRPRPQRVSP